MKKNVKKLVLNHERSGRNPDFPGFFKDFHKSEKFLKNVIKRIRGGQRPSSREQWEANPVNPIPPDSFRLSKISQRCPAGA
ncbi:hypothetical protein [Brucella intermedia]|uniref:hypothetical protein n=1 Tax=Brucella intermedia TaxID=94625 RepID=UPI0012D2FDA3|nr:hypothetical protein [Brucella intermedia]